VIFTNGMQEKLSRGVTGVVRHKGSAPRNVVLRPHTCANQTQLALFLSLHCRSSLLT
jgi:hypothetical protein